MLATTNTIPVVVNGALGKMGSETVAAVQAAPTLELIARVDPAFAANPEPDAYATLDDLMKAECVQPATQHTVLVDFTRPDAVEANLRQALPLGFDCVVGTTGLSEETLTELGALLQPGRCLFVAPNFAIGAVLMMQLVQQVAPHMPDAEIIELHHNQKLDAPSGTALRTAELIAAAREAALPDYVPSAPGADSEMPGCDGARGADIEDVPVHSVRLPGYVAHQEVIFGGLGQTLTIRHDTTNRNSFMPGVVLACEQVVNKTGLIVGLEHFLGGSNEQ